VPEETLRVTAAARDAIVAHAREGAPEEVCGVLGGEDAADGDARVTAVERVANVASEPRNRYELDAEEQMAALDAVEGAGLSIVGFYHSHPRGPPVPSAVDRAAATWPGHVYLIVSLAGDEPTVGAWRWTGDRFRDLVVAVS
jgi:proteasome lid subunit RPN8/RPN11